MQLIKYYRIGFTILFLLCANALFSQYYILGQDPASVVWRQINTEKFRIIFPSEISDIGQNYANILEASYKEVSFPYIENNNKLQIVLHNRTVISNAMVSPTPYHADFFTMPDQDIYAQPWAKQLALHEYRHAVQMQKVNQGFTKGLKILFGDQAIGGIMGVFLPFWFIEGDAVYSETILSSSGRGRSPTFTMDLVAQVAEKGIYPYDKALYGSYKNYTPDHYTLGYELVTFGVYKYGSDLWDQTLDKVARKPFTLVPFTNSIKKKTGTGKVKYYKNTLGERNREWSETSSKASMPHALQATKRNNYTNYRFPTKLKDGTIVVEKTGIDDINRFVKCFPDGTEKILFTPGFDFQESLSANDSLLCWNERTFDPRWSNRNYSIIKVYNFKSKKLFKITRKSRLFAPDLANHSAKIVAVNVSETNEYSLQVFDFHTHDIIKEFKTTDNLFLMHPKWSEDDKYIVATVLGDKGKSIIKIDTRNWEYEFLLDMTFKNISRPSLNGSKLLYTSAYNGTDNIYMLDLDTKEITMITDVPYGATDAAFSHGSRIEFSNYTADGYRTSTTDSVHFAPANISTSRPIYLIDKIQTGHKFNLDEVSIPDTAYEERKYSRIGHLFNLHSWGIAAVDLNSYDFQPGINILSQNTLSTSWGRLGYYYDPNEQVGKVKIDYTYSGWYPTLNLTADYGMRKDSYTDQEGKQRELKWHETNLGFNMSLPLNFTKSKWITGMTPTIGIAQKFLDMIGDHDVSFREKSISSLTYAFNAYAQLKRSKRDIYPAWGASVNLIYRHTPFSDSVSSVFGTTGTFFLPGLWKHQGLRIYTAYQMLDNGNYSYSNVIVTPRGYNGIKLNTMCSFKADYALPIIYPDLNWQAVAYLKRITLHGFFDYLTGEDKNNVIRDYSSAGIELYSDWHFFSLLPNIKLGVRSTYRLNDDEFRFEFLYGFSIN